MPDTSAQSPIAWGEASDACLQIEGCITALQRIVGESLNDAQAHQALALLIRTEQLNNLIGEFIAAQGVVDPAEMSRQVLGRVASRRQQDGGAHG